MRLSNIPYKWLVTIVFVISLFMELLDTTVVYVALPALGREFNAGHAALEWIVTAYLLAIAVLIPASGWVGDRFGTRRIFLAALALFTVGSALCGLAWNVESLVAFRVIQGIGGGMMTPVGTAMLFRAFPPSERARASAVVVVPAAIAPTFGPIVGGFLVDSASWRWIFAINIPIGIAAFVLAARVLKEHTEEPGGRFDAAGLVLCAGSFSTLVYALSQAPQVGWDAPQVAGPGFLGLVLLVLLIVVERRVARPMLDVRLLADPTFAASTAIAFAATASLLGVLFVLPIYLQEIRGLSALDSGLVTFPQALALSAMTPIVNRYYRRIGPHRLLSSGMLGTALTAIPFLLLDRDTSLWAIRGLMALRGVTAGLLVITVQVVAFATLPPRDLGRASAIFHTNRQMAVSVGVAILASVLAAREATTPSGNPIATIEGFHAAMFATVGISVTGCALLLALRRKSPALAPMRAATPGREPASA